MEALQQAIAEGRSFATAEDLADAEALLKQLEQEHTVTAAIEKAMETKDGKELTTQLKVCSSCLARTT